MTRVLLVAQARASFVERDADILARHFELERFTWHEFRDGLHLHRAVKAADVTVCWFAEAHAGLSARWSPRTVTIVGGYDVLRLPGLGYGALGRGFPIPQLVRAALRRSARVLVVDPSLIEAAVRNAGVPTQNFHYVPTGFDDNIFRPPQGQPKDRSILTVATWDRVTIRRKGLDQFLEVAHQLPGESFVVAGRITDRDAEAVRANAPSNVRFAGRLSDAELLHLYQRASVYAQLSLAEGLPNALCEAMLCGCVPVGTRVNGIPNAIGDTGFVVDVHDVPGASRAILEALREPDRGDDARRRIQTRFPAAARERELVRHVAEVARFS